MATTTVSRPVKPTYGSLAINIMCLMISSWGLYWATQLVLPASLKQAGHKQFLTNISVIATQINNVTNIINWFIQRSSTNNVLLTQSDFIARHITLPIALVLETVVPIVYWPLRLFAMNLIMQAIPEDAPSPIPISVDLAIHLFPNIFLVSDHYLSGSGLKFKLSNTKAWVIVTALGMAYYKWLSLLIDPKKGQTYPYPFLDVEEPLKSIIFVVVTSFSWGFYTMYQNFPPFYKKDAKLKEV